MNAGVLTGDGDEPGLSRRKFLVAATSATAAAGVAFAVTPFIASWNPSERAKAMGGPVAVDLTKIEVGQMVIFMWRRMPMFVFKRAPEAVARLSTYDTRLKDPHSTDSDQPAYAANPTRSIRADVVVLNGICTHLGCLPKQHFQPGDAEMGADWPGGFLCPCHGSRFDLAGRVFNGSPASVNLRIPPHSFPDANTLLIGQDAAAAAAST